MAQALTPLAQYILDAADTACGEEFMPENEFFTNFSNRVLLDTPDRQEGIGAAIAEIVAAGMWPWRRT
jgi:hypothetical protein